jgi:hypothetical protein
MGSHPASPTFVSISNGSNTVNWKSYVRLEIEDARKKRVAEEKEGRRKRGERANT